MSILKKIFILMVLIIPLYPQIKDDAPVSSEELLDKIKKIIKTNQEGEQIEFQKAIKDFGDAAASPVAAENFYEQAIRAIGYKGKKNEASEYNQWKSNEATMLNDKLFQRWIQLHLSYLSLYVRRVSGETVKTLEPEILKYIDDVSSSLAVFEKESLKDRDQYEKFREESINLSLDKSPFVKWYQLNDFLNAQKNWEMIPMNVDGIYENILFPALREQKSFRLLELWEDRLLRLETMSKQSKNVVQEDKFSKVDYPRYLWARAADLQILGLKNKAYNERISILRQYPTHPHFNEWVKELQDLLKN